MVLKLASGTFCAHCAVGTAVQANGRIRRWASISEMGKYLRVITEPDGETVHNAFFDRHFKP
jgi:hypothetical protein